MVFDMANRIFRYIDDWASIRLVDSFVKDNKAGTGNGEAAFIWEVKMILIFFHSLVLKLSMCIA